MHLEFLDYVNFCRSSATTFNYVHTSQKIRFYLFICLFWKDVAAWVRNVAMNRWLCVSLSVIRLSLVFWPLALLTCCSATYFTRLVYCQFSLPPLLFLQLCPATLVVILESYSTATSRGLLLISGTRSATAAARAMY